MLPYLIRHYTTFADKLIFYDAQSTDGTREIIQACPISELREWRGRDALDDGEILELSNRQWKEARGKADWVVWVDADEFLYHPEIRELLDGYKWVGVEVPRIDGYTMVSQAPPTTGGQIYDEIRTGFADLCWGKPAIFQPKVEMFFYPGRHSMNEIGFNPVRSETAEIKLLHYRALGMDYVRARHQRNWARLPEHCKQMSYGVNCEPNHAGHHGISWFEEMLKRKWDNVI